MKRNTREYKNETKPNKKMLIPGHNPSDIAFYKGFKDAYNFNAEEFKYNGKKMSIEHQAIIFSTYNKREFRVNFFYKNRDKHKHSNNSNYVYNRDGVKPKDDIVDILLKGNKLTISLKPAVVFKFGKSTVVDISPPNPNEHPKLIKQHVEITLKDDDIEIIKDIIDKKIPTISRSKQKDIKENTKQFKKGISRIVPVMKTIGKFTIKIYKTQLKHSNSIKDSYILKIDKMSIISKKKENLFENKYLQLVVFKDNHVGIIFGNSLEEKKGMTLNPGVRNSQTNIYNNKNINLTLKDNILTFDGGDYRKRSKYHITLPYEGKELAEVEKIINRAKKPKKKQTKKNK